MLKIVDFDNKYSLIIDQEEDKYWGKWEESSIKDEALNYDIFKIVLMNNEYVGHLYGNFIDNMFYFDVILVKEEYRNRKIGTYLMENIINELKKMNCKKIVTTAEYLNNGNILLENLLLKFDFKKVKEIDGFWGNKYPHVYCKECKSKPCKCKAAVFVKEIN